MKRLLCVALSSAGIVAGLCAVTPGIASATCNYTPVSWTWAASNSYDSPNEIKGTDGCASPWVNYLSNGVNMTGWVYDGGWLNAGSTPCAADTSCSGMWNKYGWEWNGYTFHIQDSSLFPTSGDMFW